MTDQSVHSVLIVEDDPAVARMLRISLTSEGYDVRLAQHGEEALTEVDARTPSIVLLDLQMPVMDGRSFYREFRRLGFDSPVIVISAYDAEAGRRELGADAALKKPCHPDAVSDLVTSLLEQSDSTL